MEAGIAASTESLASPTSASTTTADSDAKSDQESSNVDINSDESGSQPDVTIDACVDTVPQTDGQIDMSNRDRVSRYKRDLLGRTKRRYSSCDRRRHGAALKRPVRKCKSRGDVRRPRSAEKQRKSVEKSEIRLLPKYTTDEIVTGSETDNKASVSDASVNYKSLRQDSARGQGDSNTVPGLSNTPETEALSILTCDTPSTDLCSKVTALSEQVHGDCIQSIVPTLSTLCSKVTGPLAQVHDDSIQSTVPPLSTLCLATISLLGQTNDDYVQSLVTACVNDNTMIDNNIQKGVNVTNKTADSAPPVDKIRCDLRNKLTSDDSLSDKTLSVLTYDTPSTDLCSKVAGPLAQVHDDSIQSTVSPLSALCLATISFLGQTNDDYVQSLVTACVNDNTMIDNNIQKGVNVTNKTTDFAIPGNKIARDLRTKLTSDNSLTDKKLSVLTYDTPSTDLCLKVAGPLAQVHDDSIQSTVPPLSTLCLATISLLGQTNDDYVQSLVTTCVNDNTMIDNNIQKGVNVTNKTTDTAPPVDKISCDLRTKLTSDNSLSDKKLSVLTYDTPSTDLCLKVAGPLAQVHDDSIQSTVPPLSTLCLATISLLGQTNDDYVQSLVTACVNDNTTIDNNIQKEVNVTNKTTVPPLSALCLATISLLGQTNDDYVQTLVTACVNDNTMIDNNIQKGVNVTNKTTDSATPVDKITCDLRNKLTSDDSLPDKISESASHKDLVQMYNEVLESRTQYQNRVDSLLQELSQQEGQIESLMEDDSKRQAEIDAINKKYGETIWVHQNFQDEVTKYKTTKKERKLSTAVMKQENCDLIEQVTDLLEDINEMKLKRHISGEKSKDKTNKFTDKTGQLEAGTVASKGELADIMNKLNTLKMDMIDQGLTVPLPSLAKSFDESSLLPENLRMVVSPSMFRRPGERSFDFLDEQPLQVVKSPRDDLNVDAKNRHMRDMSPHDILESKDEAMSLLHWLRCCQPRFALLTCIPGPEYFLPHGTIRYSERYTVSINNPLYLQLNRQYNKLYWLPSRIKVHNRPYISGNVRQKIVDKQELANSRLGWLQCCRFKLDLPKPGILTRSAVDDDDPATCLELANQDSYCIESHGDATKQANQPSEHLTSKADVPKENVKCGNQDAKPDAHSNNKDASLVQSQSIVAVAEVRNRKQKKVIKSKIDTGLCTETHRFPPKKMEANVKMSTSVPAARKNRKPVNIEVMHIQAKVKNAKCRIDTGLASNTRRLPPIKASKITGNLHKAAGEQLNSAISEPLSPNFILPPIKGNAIKRKDTRGERLTTVKQLNKGALPPIKPTQAVKLPNISNSKLVQPSTIKPAQSMNTMVAQAPNIRMPQPSTRKTTQALGAKLPKPRNCTSVPLDNKLVRPAVPYHQKRAGQDQRTSNKVAGRNGQLPPLKKCPKSPVRVEAPLSPKTSMCPLPAIGECAIAVNKAQEFGHINVRSSCSDSGFCHDLLRNDYY